MKGRYIMKKFINRIISKVRRIKAHIAVKIMTAVIMIKSFSRKALSASLSGEGYIDTAVVILISIVVGALLLAALYALFGDVIMPTLNERIRDMFDYAG
jgi:uncharacterized membrane protein (DUF485 family)